MIKLISMMLAFFYSFVGGFFTPVTQISVSDSEEGFISCQISVMTYNVYIMGTGKKSPENRARGVAETIRSIMPDSFGAEEADEAWLKRLCELLPEYAYTGMGREADFSGEASPVFYLKDKYELVDSKTLWLSKTPDLPSRSWDAWINRVASIAVLRDKQTGFVYAHVNAHFDNIGSISRNEAVAIISKEINELNMPVVFSGDLNAKEGSLMYKRIIEAGLEDTKYLAEKSDAGATYHGYTGLDKTNDRPIDYIFVNGYVESVSEYGIIRDKIDGIYPSDHYPVYAKLTLRSNGQSL